MQLLHGRLAIIGSITQQHECVALECSQGAAAAIARGSDRADCIERVSEIVESSNVEWHIDAESK